MNGDCWETFFWIITLFTSSGWWLCLPGRPWSWQIPDLSHHPSDLRSLSPLLPFIQLLSVVHSSLPPSILISPSYDLLIFLKTVINFWEEEEKNNNNAILYFKSSMKALWRNRWMRKHASWQMGKTCLCGGRTIVCFHWDIFPAVGTAAVLINQDRSRFGMLAITWCERAL